MASAKSFFFFKLCISEGFGGESSILNLSWASMLLLTLFPLHGPSPHLRMDHTMTFSSLSNPQLKFLPLSFGPKMVGEMLIWPGKNDQWGHHSPVFLPDLLQVGA